MAQGGRACPQGIREPRRDAGKLAAGAIVVADNMLFPEHSREDAAAYRRRVRDSGQFDTVVLPVGSGIELSRLRS